MKGLATSVTYSSRSEKNVYEIILKQTCARRQRWRRPARRRPSPWWHCKHKTTTLAGHILAILTYCIWRTDAIKCSAAHRLQQGNYRRRRQMIIEHSAISDANISHRLLEIFNIAITVKREHQVNVSPHTIVKRVINTVVASSRELKGLATYSSRSEKNVYEIWKAQTKSGLSQKIKFPTNSCPKCGLRPFYNGQFICSGTIKCWLSPLFHWCVHIPKQTCARRQRCRRPGRRRPSSWWHCKHETTTLAGRIIAILTYCIRKRNGIKCNTPSSKRQLLRKTIEIIIDHSVILPANFSPFTSNP